MNDDCCYKLYMHLNKTNGKVYIGQTKLSYRLRWNDGKGYGSCSRFAKAIKKYGWNGFEHIPLIEKLFKIDVDYFERFFIAFFDSQNPEFGYNLTAGGDENPMDNSIIRENHREALKNCTLTQNGGKMFAKLTKNCLLTQGGGKMFAKLTKNCLLTQGGGKMFVKLTKKGLLKKFFVLKQKLFMIHSQKPRLLLI